MIKEQIKRFLEELMRVIEELDEAHTIITRKPWVLWNDREEDHGKSSSFIQRLVDCFNF